MAAIDPFFHCTAASYNKLNLLTWLTDKFHELFSDLKIHKINNFHEIAYKVF